MAVFHGVEMDVVAEDFEFFFVADRVFPESALPKAAFLVGLTRGADGKCGSSQPEEVAGEFMFNDLPAKGEIPIAGRQGPQAMQMIG